MRTLNSTIILATLLITTLLTASAVSAEGALGLYGIAGLGGEAEADQLSTDQGDLDLDDEDLEKTFGAAISADYEVMPNLYLGGRVAYRNAEGDKTDQSLTTIDFGGMARYVIPLDSVELMGILAVGPTLVQNTYDDRFFIDNSPADFSSSGLGYHINLAAGLAIPMSDSLSIVGLLSYDHQQAGELSGELDPDSAQVQSIDAEVEDVSISRFTIQAGVSVDLF